MELKNLVYIDRTGYHYADYPSFLEWRKQQYRDIYGEDVYLEADSQDGQLLATQALADYQTAVNGAAVFAAQSPLQAQGVGLSTRVKINGISRQVPTKSTASVLITGTVGTTITNGIVEDTLGQKWNLPATVTIGGGGTVTVTATAQELGAISAQPSTLTKIFTPTRGWQLVNNAAAATEGAPVESDAALRVRQQISVANPSLTVLDGTKGAVANVVGVTASKGYENDTGSTDANGIPAHKICMIVAGGANAAIATAIALHKTPGTGTFGNVTQTVYDSHGMPIQINFKRPTAATITATVTLSAGVGWSSDFEVLIKKSVADTIKDFGIGSIILLSKLYAPAYLIGTAPGETFNITTIVIGKGAGAQGSANINLAFDEQPNCDYAVNVTIVVT